MEEVAAAVASAGSGMDSWLTSTRNLHQSQSMIDESFR
jgi:hypothetical protein